MTCYRNMLTDSKVAMAVSLEGHQYHCDLNVDLPEKFGLHLEKFECQFADDKTKLLIDDSCVAVFTVFEENSRDYGLYDTLLWCMLSIMLGKSLLFYSFKSLQQQYFLSLIPSTDFF